MIIPVSISWYAYTHEFTNQ